MPEYVGQQLGNYHILRLLGEGGFAQVYLGEHVYLKTMAAIKILLANLPDNDLQAFLQEARIVARLRHPHIVRVLEFGVTPEQVPFLAMTYAPHGTLRQRHPKGTVVALEDVIAYVKQVASALQCAHDQKLIHRDVKPENMLLGQTGGLLLSDFGIAVAARNTLSQSSEEISGTVLYMAPEQLQGRPRPASDQYALAAVVYEWLCGTPPFTGSGFMAVAIQHLQTPPPPLRSRVSNLSPDVDVVVMRALAKEPSARFEHVLAFAQALEAACGPGIPSPSRSVSSSSTASSPQSSIYSTINPYAVTVTPLNGPATPTMKSTLPTIDAPFSSQPPRDHFSRRTITTVLTSVLGLGVLSGGIAWGVLTHGSSSPSPSLSLLTTATRVPLTVLPSRPQGTTLVTYSQHTGAVTGIAWSPDGGQIASSSNDKTVRVWSPVENTTLKPFIYSNHPGKVLTVSWSPDGRYIASGSDDKTVRVWDAPQSGNNKPGTTLVVYQTGNLDIPAALAWSPDSKHVASTDGFRQMETWDASSGKQAIYYPDPAQAAPFPVSGPVNAVAWSPDGLHIVSSVLTVAVWSVAGGDRVLTYNGHHTPYNVHGLAWSPDSKHIASAGEDKTVLVWDATTGDTLLTYKGHTDAVYAVSWSRDGKYLASASRDKTVQIWEAASGKHLFTYREHTAPVNAVAWSGDSRHITSGGDDGRVLVWQGV